MRTKLQSTLVAIAVSSAMSAQIDAATSDPFVFTDEEGASATRVVIAGVTLGNNWVGFPTTFAPGYDPGAEVDVTLPLYVTWLSDSEDFNGDPIQVTPTPITQYDWFQEAGGSAFRVELIQQRSGDGVYTRCPDGGGLESPMLFSSPDELHLFGELHVKDTHGGIADNTVILISRFFQIGTNPNGGRAHLILAWDHPDTYWDDFPAENNPVHATPGTVYNRRVRRQTASGFIDMFTHVRIIEWPAADFAGTEDYPGVPDQHGPSPRYVDGSDSAYFFNVCWGRPFRWGLE